MLTVYLNGQVIDPATIPGYAATGPNISIAQGAAAGGQWTIRADGLIESLVTGANMTHPAPWGLATVVDGKLVQQIGAVTADHPAPPGFEAQSNAMLAASDAAAGIAPNALAAMDPASPNFGENYRIGTSELGIFDAAAAVSPGWWESQGYSMSDAYAKASAAATKLGVSVPKMPPATVSQPAAPPVTYATPPGAKLPTMTGDGLPLNADRQGSTTGATGTGTPPAASIQAVPVSTPPGASGSPTVAPATSTAASGALSGLGATLQDHAGGIAALIVALLLLLAGRESSK